MEDLKKLIRENSGLSQAGDSFLRHHHAAERQEGFSYDDRPALRTLRRPYH